MSARDRFGPLLTGRSLDVGAGHMPFPAAGATVLLDRWTAGQHLALFPELAGNRLPDPDVIADAAVLPFADGALDSVVCSHVVEHVADPLGLLDELHRIIRPGGQCLLVVPDRRGTFDAGRPATTLAHLEAERGRVEVDDEHIVEFLTHVIPVFAGTPLEDILTLPNDPDARADRIGWHRRRSVHAHCWTADEFIPLLTGWTIEDRIDDQTEFAFLLS